MTFVPDPVATASAVPGGTTGTAEEGTDAHASDSELCSIFSAAVCERFDEANSTGSREIFETEQTATSDAPRIVEAVAELDVTAVVEFGAASNAIAGAVLVAASSAIPGFRNEYSANVSVSGPWVPALFSVCEGASRACLSDVSDRFFVHFHDVRLLLGVI